MADDQTVNAMRAGFGRLALSPAKLKDVYDAVRTSPQWVPEAIGNAMTGLAEQAGRWMVDPSLPSSRGDTDIGRDATLLGPGMLMPGFARAAGGAAAELGAAGGRATQVSKILNQPEIQTLIKVGKQTGKTDAEIAELLNDHFRLEPDTITSRMITGNRQRAGVPGVRAERTEWTPEMVDELRSLAKKHGSDRYSIYEGFRDKFPDYAGTDATLRGQLSKINVTGGVNSATGMPRPSETGIQSGKLSQEHWETIADLANKPDMMLKDKIAAFREAHPDFEVSNGTIVRRLKDAEAGDFELGAMGGRGPGGRITAEDVQALAEKLGTGIREMRTDPKNGTVYARIPSAENPGNQLWDTMVRIPTDTKSHAGRRLPESNQYVIDTTDAPAKRIDPNIATNMGGGRYSDIGNLEAALRARNGEPIPDELRPAPQQLPLRGSKVFPREGRPTPKQGEPPEVEAPDPRQLKLLAGGAPVAPFETTIERTIPEDNAGKFAAPGLRETDAVMAQDTGRQADTNAMATKDAQEEADAMEGRRKLRFLPPGFILDKPNAMRLET